MGFLRKLFGGGDKKPVDKRGLYFYVQCDNCGAIVRVRADKQYDLNSTGSGYEWHKTIVDSKCFRRIQTVVQLDSNYSMVNHETRGGQFVTKADWDAQESARRAPANQPDDANGPDEDTGD